MMEKINNFIDYRKDLNRKFLLICLIDISLNSPIISSFRVISSFLHFLTPSFPHSFISSFLSFLHFFISSFFHHRRKWFLLEIMHVDCHKYSGAFLWILTTERYSSIKIRRCCTLATAKRRWDSFVSSFGPRIRLVGIRYICSVIFPRSIYDDRCRLFCFSFIRSRTSPTWPRVLSICSLSSTTIQPEKQSLEQSRLLIDCGSGNSCV